MFFQIWHFCAAHIHPNLDAIQAIKNRNVLNISVW
uniref:Uncharacterized protein n=1 Tax=Anguilla anguilla TaxID=7936 RepID=A0A0E9W7G7_ANGAN